MTDTQQELDALGTQAAQLLSEGQWVDARKLLLDAWLKQRRAVLADLIDAIDLRISRTPEAWVPEAVEMQHKMYAFSHDWRQWFTRDPDQVANRLAIFEAYPEYAFSEPWPMCPFIRSVTVQEWDDALSEVIQQLESVRELRNVPWHAVRGLDLSELELLHIDHDGPPLGELVKTSPRLREFQGTCGGSLALFDQLRSLERVALTMPVTADRVVELGARSVPDRRLVTPWCEHRLLGQPGSLRAETTVLPQWPLTLGAEQGYAMPEQLFEQLDATRELFRGLVEWSFSPGNADRVEELREWIESRAN